MAEQGETTFLDGRTSGDFSMESVIKGIDDPDCENTSDSTNLSYASNGNSNTTEIVPNLLPEIIMDILSRLPIEDIMRFKIVSKGWSDLTKEPHFIEMHLKRALCLPCSLIVEPKVKGAINNLYLIDRGDDMWRGREIPIRNIEGNYMLTLASCHGLLCVAGTCSEVEPLFIYNPITKESVELPKTTLGLGDCSLSVGFGFDPTNKKYKVVRLFKFYKEGNPKTSMKCEIITVGEVSWRELEASHQVVCGSNTTPLFLDGSLHWTIDTVVHPGRDRILILDLCNEKFRTIKFPSSLIDTIKFPHEVFLLNLEGSLSLVEHGYWEKFYVWRIARSSTKTGYKFYCSSYNMTIPYKVIIWSINLKDKLMDNSFLFHVKFIQLGEEGERTDHLSSYNPEQREYRIVDVSGIPKFFKPTLFVPSLVSPCAAYGNRDQEVIRI